MMPFDDWAEWYDRVYAYLRHDLSFYVEQAVTSKGPVLELGCGTGRVALAIAAEGIDVTGVDLSPGMLEIAERKARLLGLTQHCELVAGDMREVRLDQRYAMVIMPFRSFQHMLTPAEQREVLATVRTHLQPGGLLIFDIFAPDLEMLAASDPMPFHIRDVPEPETGSRLVLYGQNRWDHIGQTNETRLIVELVDSLGEVSRRVYRDFTIRYTFLYEMHHLLEVCGFKVEALYGDFEGNPVSEETSDLVWLARCVLDPNE